MKHLKKLIAAALTMFVAFAVGTVALAQTVEVGTGDGSITITNAAKDSTYKLFQLFDATVGSNGKIAYSTTKNVTNDTVFNKYFEIKNGNIIKKDTFTNAVLKTDEFKNWAASFGTQVGDDVVAADSTVKFDKIPYGYYYVETSLGAVITVDSANPTADVIDKNSTVEFDKNIVLNGELVKVNEAGLGIDVPFDITVTAMNYDGEEKIFEYVVYDTMEPGFSLKAAPVVKVGGTTLTAGTDGDYTITYKKAGVATDTITEADSFEISIPWTSNGTKSGTHLYGNPIDLNVTYTAILDPAKATEVDYGNDANENTADVKYYKGNDEPGHPSGDLPDKKTETYDTKVTILKTDGDRQPLTGAGFTLTTTDGTGVVLISTDEVFTEDENGTYYKLNDGTYTTEAPNGEEEHDADYDSITTKYTKTVTTSVKGLGQTDTAITAMVGNDGKLSFTGLGAGTYKLEETTVPAGYNKAADIEFTLTFNATTKKFTSSNANVVPEGDTNVFGTTVVNQAGTELPSTGGIGTTIFYIVGGIMVVAAGVLLITKKRVANN